MQLIFNGFNGSPHGIGRIPWGEPLDGLSSLPCSTPQPPRSLGVCHPPRRVLLRLQRTRRSRGRPSTLPLVSQITPFVVGRLLALSVKWGVCVGEMWVHPSLSVGGGYWSRQDFLFFVGGGCRISPLGWGVGDSAPSPSRSTLGVGQWGLANHSPDPLLPPRVPLWPFCFVVASMPTGRLKSQETVRSGSRHHSPQSVPSPGVLPEGSTVSDSSPIRFCIKIGLLV